MVAVLIVLFVVVVFSVRWVLKNCGEQDDAGPIVSLDQQAPYKVEPPQHNTESESSQSN